MGSTRLLTMLLLLQNCDRMTATQLADVLEVSVRTIHRDIDNLSAAGIPVVSERGAHGGFRLMDGYRTRLTGLTQDEASALFLTGVPDAAQALGRGDQAQAALLKVLAALPGAQRAQAVRFRDAFMIDPEGWFDTPSDHGMQADVVDAVLARQRVRLVYDRSWKRVEPTTVTVNPLGVVGKAGTWYLLGDPGSGPRIYRIDRIVSMEVLSETFEPEPGFSLQRTWSTLTSAFEESIHGESIEIELLPSAWPWLSIALASYQLRAIHAQGVIEQPDSPVRVTLPVESLEHAHWDVMKLAPHFRIISPPELKEKVTDVARQLIAIHEE